MCLCFAGVVLISLALCADAVIGNVQEKAMKLHNGSNSEMVNGFLHIYSHMYIYVYVFLEKNICRCDKFVGAQDRWAKSLSIIVLITAAQCHAEHFIGLVGKLNKLIGYAPFKINVTGGVFLFVFFKYILHSLMFIIVLRHF